MINNELIRRFFKNQCTPEEARQVSDYLREHPEELERQLSEAAFMDFQEERDLPETVSSEWLAHIHNEARIVPMGSDMSAVTETDGVRGESNMARKSKPLKWIRVLAAAAIIGGVVIGANWLLRRSGQTELSRLEPAPAIASIPKDEQERTENTSGRILPVLLPDGSLIRLMPKGAVVYHKKFTENRNVYLQGEAGFEVTSDKAHAFTVFSGEVSTRVLGTSFQVRALPEDDIITVRLNTGKVMVGAEVLKRKTIADVILTPGKELRYSKKNMTVTVTNFNNTTGEILVKAGNTQYKGLVRPDWYKFSNQPISDVLDQLSNYFGVAIYYYPADVKQIYFEGKFDKADSLEKILMDITLPNNLKFVRGDSGIVIKKK